jgi:hypothetical protein
MSDDIVKRLREADPEGLPFGTEQMCDEAAEEIERFRAENERLRGAIMQCEIIVRQFQIENEERGKNAVSNNARLKYRAVADRSGVLFCSVKRIARAALKEQP